MLTHGLAAEHVNTRVAALRCTQDAPRAAKSHEPCALVADSWPRHCMEVAEASRALHRHPKRRVASETDTNQIEFGKCNPIHHCATSFWYLRSASAQ